MLEYRPIEAMDEPARQMSLSIDSVARALAEWTVSRHHEADEALPRRYGRGWRTGWVADVENRIRHLAQAIAVRRPAVLVHTVSMAGSAFAARDAGADDLARSLECMREVLVSELPETIGAVAIEYLDQARRELDRARVEDDRIEAGHAHGSLMLKYLEAVLDGRRADAASVVLDAADAGTGVPDLYSQVLERAQTEVGRMWHRGEISVADEHFATATTEHVMSLLRARLPDVPRRNRRAVATAVAGDLHSLGVRMVAEFLDIDGWDVIYFGANTPSADVIGALVDHRADLLAASATSFLNLRALGELIDAVRRAPELSRVRVIVGGAPFNLIPDLHAELGADATADSAPQAVEAANALVAARS